MPIYICPLSLAAPKVPVLTNEGITYDFVWIAQSLLRGNTNNIHSTLDPITHGAIDTLIYNRAAKELNDALIEEVLPLSHDEKTEIALLYAQLVGRYPALRIYGVHTLEGMQALIGAPMPALQIAPQRALIAQGLWNAAYEGHLPVVTALLAAGADINQAATDDGATPLFIATQEGHLPVVTALLDAGAASNQATTDDGSTPLFIAAQNGHLPMVTALLDAGADINQAITDGATPLLIAAQNGHLPVVTALLDAGADINQAMTDGATPLYTAVLFAHFEVTQALLHHQQAIMAHLPVSIIHQQGYPALVKAWLSDEAVRDYYLNQIIIKPELMRDAFTQNPVFFTELATYRNEIWARLRGAAHFNLSSDAHKALLKSILNSRQVPDEAQRHPLHALFTAPQPTGRFSFFSLTVNITLNDILSYANATYPELTPSIH